MGTADILQKNLKMPFNFSALLFFASELQDRAIISSGGAFYICSHYSEIV